MVPGSSRGIDVLASLAGRSCLSGERERDPACGPCRRRRLPRPPPDPEVSFIHIEPVSLAGEGLALEVLYTLDVRKGPGAANSTLTKMAYVTKTHYLIHRRSEIVPVAETDSLVVGTAVFPGVIILGIDGMAAVDLQDDCARYFRGLVVVCRINWGCGRVVAQAATSMVLPHPGPALTRVAAASFDSASMSRGRNTAPWGSWGTSNLLPSNAAWLEAWAPGGRLRSWTTGQMAPDGRRAWHRHVVPAHRPL